MKVENILKVIDISNCEFDAKFLSWFWGYAQYTYKDTGKYTNEHLYNPDDFEELTDVPKEYSSILEEMKELCKINDAGYIRII